jgi:(1->4)-alpha-D-glucan 1-alpha-D-glucosylmutase
VTGVRLDHVDGLYDPSSYLHSLQRGRFVGSRSEAFADEAACGKGEADPEAVSRDRSDRPLYVLCEKILMKGEPLPEEWPVFGTTGYDFLNQVNGIFVDTENAKAFDRIYHRTLGRVTDFQEVVYEKKKLVMQVSLSGEVNMLGQQLNTLSERDRLTRDFTLNSLTRAITEVIAFFPVYRTYVNSGSVRDKDIQYVESAVSKAKRKNPAISASIFDFLRSVLLLKFPEHATREDKKSWLYFVMHFQQITGPVMAKGVEDTAFYVYNRLVSLNDVGGSPGRFGISLEAFHGQNLERAKSFPHTMLATATHDTKRGEDVRTRIDALSEIPARWAQGAGPVDGSQQGEGQHPRQPARAGPERGVSVVSDALGRLAPGGDGPGGLRRLWRPDQGVHDQGDQGGQGEHQLGGPQHALRRGAHVLR